MNLPSKLLLSTLLLAVAGVTSAINIVQNPGFQQGAVGWDYGHYSIVNSPLWAHAGPGEAKLTYCSQAVVRVEPPPLSLNGAQAAFDVSEPGMYVLLMAALGAMVFVQRRRR